jgi:hypothetical protein
MKYQNLCPGCDRYGLSEALEYVGTERISPAIQVVCLRCDCGYRRNDKMSHVDAGDLIKKMTTT